MVTINTRKKFIEISTKEKSYTLPFALLRLKPTSANPIVDIYVDSELGNEGITYSVKSGEEDSLHLDDFLEYHRDPDYVRRDLLYKLSLEAQKAVTDAEISISELARRLETSRAQINRLLEPSNYQKTIDQVMKVLSVLGRRIEVQVA